MTLNERILSHKVLLLDGATGSQLIAQGLSAGECPEYWNISHPEIIKGVAASYFNAGSDAVLTNTFGGSLLKLKAYNLVDQAYELNFQAARHAISVKPDGKYILGSIGPSGLMLEPYGEVTETEMTASFAVQVKAMADAGVDGFMLETFTDLGEIFCAVNAVKENSDLPFFASMTFGATPDGFKTMMGVGVEDFIAAMEGAGALLIGSNCGNGIVRMIELAKEFRSVSGTVNLMLKANAGEPHLHDGQLCYSESPEVFAANLTELLKLSPSAVGGCCGTNPEHIRKIRLLIDSL
jgi:5-methyltetrahydrofolate--homocysteine methyltransferase